MTLLKNPRTKRYEADFKGGPHGRLHVSLRTERKDVGMTRHAAVEQFVREASADLVQQLRDGVITVEQIAAAVRDKVPFARLLQTAAWPAFDDAVASYLDFIRNHAQRAHGTYTTAKSQIESVRDFVAVATRGKDRRVRIGELRLDAVHSFHIEQYVAAERARGLDPWTVTMKLIRLGALYRWHTEREPRAAREERRQERILHSPILPEWMASANDPRTRFLEEAEAERLVAATPDRLRFAVLAGFLAGLRIGEVVTLRPTLDVDLQNGLLIVQEKILPNGRRWRPKSRKRREVPIPSELVDVAAHHIARYATEAWMMPGIVRPEWPLNRTQLGIEFVTVVTNAKLTPGRGTDDGVTFHTLRHTFASWLVMRGIDLKTIATLMGHATTREVERTYGHLSPDHKRRAVTQLGEWYREHGAEHGADHGAAHDASAALLLEGES